MVDYKVGQVLNFSFNEGIIMKLESFVNKIHYDLDVNFTHSALVGHVDEQGVYLYEAIDKGIYGSYYSKKALDEWFANGMLAIGTTNVEVTGIESLCEKHVGEPYDYMNLWDILVYWFTGKTKVKSSDDNSWICSEFVAEMLHQANPEIDIVKELSLPEDDYVAPMDIYLSKSINWQYNKNG